MRASPAPPTVVGVSSETVETADPLAEDREGALAARLDHLEHVLREEVVHQKERADRAEAQLLALGDLDAQATELVSEARAEASKVLEAARHAYDQAAAMRQDAEALLEEAKKEAERLSRVGTRRQTMLRS
jgi:hypothetical protein